MARVVTFGEIMMRLAPPGYQRFIQAHSFDVSYAGGEANVAASLAQFGHEASFVTVLPDNALADAAIAFLRYYGVDTSRVVRSNVGRLGVYFLETGAAQRASRVIYDRAGSTVAITPPDVYDWSQILNGYDHFHTTGITPALGENCARATLDALRTAKQLGLTTSFDLNYRAKLWSTATARRTVEPMLEFVDTVIGNEEDAKNVLGIEAAGTDVQRGEVQHAAYEEVARKIAERHHVANVAITLRESESASVNHWSACLLSEGQFLLSERYTIQVVDRVGAGDSFCGGLLAARLDGMTPADALEFAVAASCLKHSIPGDFNKVSKDEVLRLCSGDASGRVVR
ncbi:MAG: sugar kinase [Planctomycetales bacterium]|nr:sugar kinase [Planctomycetales bacterium]